VHISSVTEEYQDGVNSYCESLTAEREQVRKIHNMSFCHLGIHLLRLVPFLQLAIHILHREEKSILNKYKKSKSD
jgi:hypothetical protein